MPQRPSSASTTVGYSSINRCARKWPALEKPSAKAAECDLIRLSDRHKRVVRVRRQLDTDGIAGADLAAGDDDAHNAGLAHQIAALVASQCRRHQSILNVVELAARVAQTGYLDDRRRAEMQLRAGRQPQQIDAARRDVLAHLPGRDGEAALPQLVVQLGMDQMDLAQ